MVFIISFLFFLSIHYPWICQFFIQGATFTSRSSQPYPKFQPSPHIKGFFLQEVKHKGFLVIQFSNHDPTKKKNTFQKRQILLICSIRFFKSSSMQQQNSSIATMSRGKGTIRTYIEEFSKTPLLKGGINTSFYLFI